MQYAGTFLSNGIGEEQRTEIEEVSTGYVEFRGSCRIRGYDWNWAASRRVGPRQHITGLLLERTYIELRYPAITSFRKKRFHVLLLSSAKKF